MKNKKTIIYVMAVLILSILFVFQLAACGKTPTPDDDKEQTTYFTIRFNTNGGTSVKSIKIKKGEAITLPDSPTKEGYIFDGWYLDDGFVEQFNATQIISANITVYAKWRLPNDNEIYISFDTDGGSKIEGYYAIVGTTINLPSAPTKQGFDFEAWKYGDNTYAAGAEFLVLNENMQFVALWISQNLRYVTYETNGGSEIEQSVVEDGSKLTAPKQPKRPGYLFAGWYKDEDCTALWDFDKDKVTENITLYAKWNVDAVGISSVEGASIDGTNIFMVVDKDVEFVELAEKVILSGNAYWNLYYDRLGQTKIPTKIAANKDSGNLNKKSNVFYILVTSEDGLQEKLYTLSIYRRITINVQYYDVYGNELYATEMDNYNTIEKPFDYNPKGYTLRGWKYNYTETGTKEFVFGDNGTVVTNENKLKLYPKATVNSYKVNLQVGKDETVSKDTVYVSYDSSITLPVPTKTGYSFTGWYYGSIEVTSNNGNCPKWTYAQEVTLYPRWEINSYTVTLSGNASGVTMNGGGLHEYNSKVTISTTTKAGYVWIGWFEGETKLTDDVQYVFTMKDADRQFTAKWSKITLKKNIGAAGSVEVQNACKAGENVTVKATTNIGYTFIGWFEDEVKLSDEQEYTFKATEQNRTLTAKWSTITLEKNISAAGSVQATIANKVGGDTTIKATTNIGYIFIGWFEGEEKLSDKQEYTFKATEQNRTLTAKWEVVEEMQNFVFTSTATTCTITSIKNKTISSIVVPDYVTSIGGYAFEYCSGLTSIVIPDSVTSIGAEAFAYCNGLTSVTIPNSVTRIGLGAFKGCSGLTNITLPFVGTSKTASNGYDQVFGYIFGYTTASSNSSAVSGATYQYYGGNSKYYYYYIPSSIKSVTITGGNIPSRAFWNCSGLTSVTIGNSVTSIGNGSFSGCSSLESITIPFVGEKAGVTNRYPFGYIFGTSSYTGGVETGQAYYGYYTTYYLPSSLKSVTVTGGNILYGAFYNCSSLTSIVIPDGVTSIDSAAFHGCSSLTSITIPDGVTSIGDYAFRDCSSLTSITIPDGVTSIGDYAFYGCSGLTSITIPDSVTSIGGYAFEYCSGLTIVLYAGTEEQWKAISIGVYNSSLTSATRVYNYDGAEHTYSFVTNCDQSADPITAKYLSSLPTLTRDGYHFCGWYDNEAFEGKAVSAPYCCKDKTTLYAKWLTEEEWNALPDGTSFEKAYIAESGQNYDVTITTGGQIVYFVFTPTTSGAFTIQSTGSGDTHGTLCGSTQSSLTANDDGGDGSNFKITYTMTAGTTYYVAVKFYSSSTTGTFKVSFS